MCVREGEWRPSRLPRFSHKRQIASSTCHWTEQDGNLTSKKVVGREGHFQALDGTVHEKMLCFLDSLAPLGLPIQCNEGGGNIRNQIYITRLGEPTLEGG